MPSFDITKDMDRFEDWIVGELGGATQKGMYSAGLRLLQTIQVTLIPKAMPHPPVDRGIYRAGCAIDGDPGYGETHDPTPVTVYNPTPQAPIIEWGARAENIKIGKKMIDALSEWVVRKGIGGETKKSVEGPAKPSVPKASKSEFEKAFKRLLKALADFIKRQKTETHTNEKGEKVAAAVSDAKARSMAWAIAKKMQQRGIFGGTGLRIFEQAEALAPEILEKEVAREIERRFK